MKNSVKPFLPFLFLFFILCVMRLFVLSPVKVSGHSMDPTLANNQRLLVYRLAKIEPGDLVICREPGKPKRQIVKRVIGIAGDTLNMQDDVLTRNGKPQEETYLKAYHKLLSDGKLASAYDYDESYQELAKGEKYFTTPNFNVKVPAGKYFVLGDNRLISEDSRFFGFVSEQEIIGKAFFSYWPLDQIHLIP